MPSKTRTHKSSKKTRGIGNPLRKRLYTLKEAGVYLGRSEYSVRTLIWNGVLPVIKNPGGDQNGKKQWVDILDPDLFIESNKETIQ